MRENGEITPVREDPTRAIRNFRRWGRLRRAIGSLDTLEQPLYVPDWTSIQEIIYRAHRNIDAPSVIELMARRGDPIAIGVVRKHGKRHPNRLILLPRFSD